MNKQKNKFVSVIAILDGFPDSTGEVLSKHGLTISSNTVPVTVNFEQPVIGEASIKLDNDKVVAEFSLDDSLTEQEIQEFSGAVGGTVFERNGNYVEKWNINSVGLTKTPADWRLWSEKLKKID